jgi:hypothetical protein
MVLSCSLLILLPPPPPQPVNISVDENVAISNDFEINDVMV